MVSIKYKIVFILTYSANWVICETDKKTTFAINNTKLYVPVVILSTQDNKKILLKLKSRLKCIINWNKYQ